MRRRDPEWSSYGSDQKVGERTETVRRVWMMLESQRTKEMDWRTSERTVWWTGRRLSTFRAGHPSWCSPLPLFLCSSSFPVLLLLLIVVLRAEELLPEFSLPEPWLDIDPSSSFGKRLWYPWQQKKTMNGRRGKAGTLRWYTNVARQAGCP